MSQISKHADSERSYYERRAETERILAASTDAEFHERHPVEHNERPERVIPLIGKLVRGVGETALCLFVMVTSAVVTTAVRPMPAVACATASR